MNQTGSSEPKVCKLNRSLAAKQHSHAGDDFSKFSLNAKKSLKDFENLNKNAGMDINKYVELYNSKI